MSAFDLLKSNCWGLAETRAQARQLLALSGHRRAARELVAASIMNDPELRKRAADVGRRITEIDAEFLTRTPRSSLPFWRNPAASVECEIASDACDNALLLAECSYQGQQHSKIKPCLRKAVLSDCK